MELTVVELATVEIGDREVCEVCDSGDQKETCTCLPSTLRFGANDMSFRHIIWLGSPNPPPPHHAPPARFPAQNRLYSREDRRGSPPRSRGYLPSSLAQTSLQSAPPAVFTPRAFAPDPPAARGTHHTRADPPAPYSSGASNSTPPHDDPVPDAAIVDTGQPPRPEAAHPSMLAPGIDAGDEPYAPGYIGPAASLSPLPARIRVSEEASPLGAPSGTLASEADEAARARAASHSTLLPGAPRR